MPRGGTAPGARAQQSSVRSPRPSTRAKQLRVIAAARRLFLERGYVGTSMDAVASEAGIAKQTLYAYYPGKADLFAAVLRDLTVERSGEPVQLPPALAIPRDRVTLRRALRQLVGRVAAAMFQPEFVALLRVLVAEVPRAPDLGDLFRRVVPDRTLGVVAGVLRAGSASGLVRQVDPDTAATLLIGALVLRVVRDALLVPPGAAVAPSPEELDDVVDQFLLGALPCPDARP
jgi:TetR/AcrR family transcriptional regulator, mexJK operon transcriptional repressor